MPLLILSWVIISAMIKSELVYFKISNFGILHFDTPSLEITSILRLTYEYSGAVSGRENKTI